MTAYQLRTDYVGLGVVTGSFSGGLIALDIDGAQADARYQEVAGEEYEAYGDEKTISWTSGKPGRRQILYQGATSSGCRARACEDFDSAHGGRQVASGAWGQESRSRW